jgi:peptide deformylase
MFKLHYEPSTILHNPVEQFNFDVDPVKLEKDMIEVMLTHRGVGLAANQIGLNARVFVMGSYTINGFIEPRIFINPHITEVSEETKLDKEGCLSFPNLFLNINRPTWIKAVFQDTNQNWIEMRADGYMAKCFQHEYDHLSGICFTDRVGKLKLDMAMKKLRKART